MSVTLETLNKMDTGRASEILSGLVENADWLSARAMGRAPFATAEAVADALAEAICGASPAEQIALLRGHPELAGAEAATGTMGEASTAEQSRLGLLALSAAERQHLVRLNAAYRETFGWPFILALHRVADLRAVFDAVEHRLRNAPDAERAVALAEVASVTRARVMKRFGSAPREAGA